MIDFAYQSAQQTRCGCYALGLPDSPPQKNVLLPLRSCEFQFEVVNAMANVTLLQSYQNPTDKFLEAQYSFPKFPNSCVYRLAAEFGGHRIQGVVKEKENAKQEYEYAVKEGKKAVYGQHNEKNSDTLILIIGNIGPKERVTIQIQYLHELSLSYNTFYELKVPASITPRYLRSYTKKQLLSAYRPYGTPKVEVEFYWNFQISLRTTRKVTFFNSNSHKLAVIKENDKCTEYLLSLPRACLPNRDFIFSYTTEDYELPNCVFGRSDKSSTAMLSFIPKFCSLSINDAYRASIEGKVLQGDMGSAKGEYIFLLDRSGSMAGKRIQKAKESLVLFIKSLPKDSFFNIISFGSEYMRLFEDSQRYDNNSIETAVATVRKMSADFGSTQIYTPLSDLLSEINKQGYVKHIYLLTDGGVVDTNKIIQMIGRNNKYVRVHSIGIGNGASPELIIGSAKSGKGQYVFIDDNEDPSEKIIQILASSLSPHISSACLKFDQDLVESIVPNPKTMPYFLKGEIVNFYITFKGQLTQKAYFSFYYEDSLNKIPYSADIVVDPESPSEPFIEKMGRFKSICILEDALANDGQIDDYIYYVKKVDKKAEILRQSVEYQILSKYTAFVCAEKQLVDGKFQEVNGTGKVKIVIEGNQQNFDKLKQSSMQHSSFHSITAKSSNFGSPHSSYGNRKDKNKNTNHVEGCGTKIYNEAYRSQLIQKKREYLEMQKERNISRSRFQNCYATMNKQSSRGFFDGIFGFFKNLFEKPLKKEKIQLINESQSKTQIKQNMIIFKDKKEKKKKNENSNKQNKNEKMNHENKELNNTEIIKLLVDEQDFDGSWKKFSLIERFFGSVVSEIVSQQKDSLAAATYLFAKWIEKNHPQKQYSLIVKKAIAFASQNADQFKQFTLLFSQYIK